MKSTNLRESLQVLVDDHARHDDIHEIALSISTGGPENVLHLYSGNHPDGPDAGQAVNENTHYYTASTSKLFATAIILQLRQQGLLSLDDRLVDFFPPNALAGLHRRNQRDLTDTITITHLLAHTSGLADYFEDRRADGSTLGADLMAGKDSAWMVDDVIQTVSTELSSHFNPGAARKAYYSDTNYQLLGYIIEKVSGKSLSENIAENITEPLGLRNTYLFARNRLHRNSSVLPLRFGPDKLTIPMAMESVRLDGGIVSTSADSLVFLQAFMQGRLFPRSDLESIQDWRSIGFPLQSGVGILKFKLPWFFTPLQTRHVLIGHSGISGAFAFYSPTAGVYLAGTLNQLNDRQLPYSFMLKIVGRIAACADT